MTLRGKPNYQIQAEFAQQLAEEADNPVKSLMIMQQWLGHDFGSHLGISGTLEEQAKGAIEKQGAVKTLGETVVFFMRHSILTPNQFSLWLTEPNNHLWYADQRMS